VRPPDELALTFLWNVQDHYGSWVSRKRDYMRQLPEFGLARLEAICMDFVDETRVSRRKGKP